MAKEKVPGWGAAKNVKKVRAKDTWGAQGPKKEPKGKPDENTIDNPKGEVWDGTRRYGLLGRKR